MSWPKPMSIVEVVWFDSQATSGWYPEERWEKLTDDSDEEDGYCRTTGYLFKETDKNIVIAQSKSHNGNLSELIQIPKLAVICQTVLKEA